MVMSPKFLYLNKMVYIVPAALAGLLAVGLMAYQIRAGARKVEIPAGTQIHLRLDQTLSTSRNEPGDDFTATLDSPVKINEKVVIPQGTPFRGHVTAAQPSGRLQGRGFLAVRLDSFELSGQKYDVATASHRWVSGSHKKRNWLLIAGGSGLGGLIGGLAGGGKGLLIGAGAGAAAGTAGAALTGRKNVSVPAETPLRFTLREPLTIQGRPS